MCAICSNLLRIALPYLPVVRLLKWKVWAAEAFHRAQLGLLNPSARYWNWPCALHDEYPGFVGARKGHPPNRPYRDQEGPNQQDQPRGCRPQSGRVSHEVANLHEHDSRAIWHQVRAVCACLSFLLCLKLCFDLATGHPIDHSNQGSALEEAQVPVPHLEFLE